MKKPKLVWFISKTDINAAGIAYVSVMCNCGNYGVHFSHNLFDENIVYFESREEAEKNICGVGAFTIHHRFLES